MIPTFVARMSQTVLAPCGIFSGAPTFIVGGLKGLHSVLPIRHQWRKVYNTLYKGAMDMRNETEATEANRPYAAAYAALYVEGDMSFGSPALQEPHDIVPERSGSRLRPDAGSKLTWSDYDGVTETERIIVARGRG